MSTLTIERPMEIATKKASQIVREWPEERTCRIRLTNGTKRCAVGMLLDEAGFDLERYRDFAPGREHHLYETLATTYGLTKKGVRDLARVHDQRGKDAAADFLEQWGM